jgi:hypothetical protein
MENARILGKPHVNKQLFKSLAQNAHRQPNDWAHA